MRMARSLVTVLALALSATDGRAVDTLIRTFKGHSGPVTSVAFSPDGRTALSGSYDETVKLWDVATGKEIRPFTAHKGRVHSIAFSPDGRTVLSGSTDKTLKLWDLRAVEGFPR